MTRNEEAACDLVIEVMRRTLVDRALAGAANAVLLMVSGGSESTARAYAAAELQAAGELGALAMLHVNHKLRGRDSDDHAQFVATLAEALGIPLVMCEIDVAGEVARTRENVEAVARRERYLAANEALESMCRHGWIGFHGARLRRRRTAGGRRARRARDAPCEP